MFDNPEKLMILLVIALLIFGPSRLAGFGGTLGRTIRDFRNSVRGAQDEARQAFSEFTQEASSTMHDMGETVQQALPAPDALADASFMSGSAEATEAAVAADTPASSSEVQVVSPDDEDPSSLASEPTAAALRETTRQVQQTGS
ncbi:MAG TPA: twin-arginine translocase TatA/TatE family subunit [bacterium]|nr:twin-arginine translocase TatA/TatE family subunit [bacterium]